MADCSSPEAEVHEAALDADGEAAAGSALGGTWASVTEFQVRAHASADSSGTLRSVTQFPSGIRGTQ